MTNTDKTVLPAGLENRIQQIVSSEDLTVQRAYVESVCNKTALNLLDCASALMFMLQNQKHIGGALTVSSTPTHAGVFRQSTQQPIKMIRYRLGVGRRHQVTAEELKKVLVEESGVDRKNIANIDIHDLYTLIELPDEMPPDIFQHLKSVEFHQHRLDIRRVKSRRVKKRNNSRNKQQRQPFTKAQSGIA